MPKDNEKSASLKLEGNKLFASGRYVEALVKYNESLLLAELGTEAVGFGYANRSACYMELKEFQHALKNIELAKENHYPADKMNKLDHREKACKETMKTHQPNPEDDPYNFFKLSHPPNPKLPFLAGCLELKVCEKYGRHIITNRDLRVGDIIAVTEPFFKIFDKRACLFSCSYCVKNSILFDLIPCTGCTEAMYCSEDCMSADKKEFHQFVCNIPNAPKDEMSNFALLKMLFKMVALFDGNVAELRSFLDANKQKCSIFDFDFSNPNEPMYQKNMMLASLSIKNGKDLPEIFLASMLANARNLIKQNEVLSEMWKAPLDGKFLDATLRNLFSVFSDIGSNFCVSSYEISMKVTDTSLIDSDASLNESDGLRIHRMMQSADQFQSLLNHSCFSNLALNVVDNKAACIVIWPTKKGEQLFSQYLSKASLSQSKVKRQKDLMDRYDFKCDCIACTIDYTIPNKIKKADSSGMFVPASDRVGKFADGSANVFYKYCDLIEATCDSLPCADAFQMIFDMLVDFAQPAPGLLTESCNQKCTTKLKSKV